jgi:hypothetical protein
MAIEASAILPSDSLEEFRVQFNLLVTDVDGITGGNTFVSSIIFEGATADAHETTLTVTDPTADRTITLPNVTGTILTTANSDAGTTTTSSGDADFVLVDDAGVLKKITPANLGVGAPAADDISAGDAAVSIATSAGNITIDAQAGDTDIIFKGTDSSSDITALTLDMSDAGKAIFNGAISATTITLSADGGVVVPDNGNIGSASSTAAMQIASDGDVTFVDDVNIGDNLFLRSDGSRLYLGANDEIYLYHHHDTGVILVNTLTADNKPVVMTLQSSEDDIAINEVIGRIDFKAGGEDSGTDAILVCAGIAAVSEGDFSASNNATKLSFRTAASETATEKMSLSSAGLLTIADDFLIKDGGTIGNASVAAVMTLASTGIVTFVDDIILKDAATIGVTSSTSAISIASTGIVTLVDDLLLKDACTIGTATTAGAIAIAADGTVDLDVAGATVASAVIKTAGKETIWVPAAAMYPSTTNPCSDLTQVETTALRPDLKVLDFATGADEFAQFTVAFPKSWNEGTVTFQPFWTVTGTNTGTVAWQLGGIAASSDDSINTAFGTLVATTALAHSGTSNDLMVSVESGAVTIAGSPAVGDCCFFQINRDISADAQSGDARLIGLKLLFTTSAATDS